MISNYITQCLTSFNLSYTDNVTQRIFFIILGTRWVHIGGKLKQIEAGPNGGVLGVNRANYIYYRAGVSRGRPTGRHWVRIGGRLNHVSLGCTGIYGVSSNGRIWKYRGLCLLVFQIPRRLIESFELHCLFVAA